MWNTFIDMGGKRTREGLREKTMRIPVENRENGMKRNACILYFEPRELLRKKAKRNDGEKEIEK